MIFRSQPSLEVLLPDLEAWFDGEVGQELLALEQQTLNELLPSLKGMHLLQMSVDSRLSLVEKSPAHHCFSIGSSLQLGTQANCVVSDHHELPLASDVVDAIVLHHVLDFAASPHQVLRECARVLRPGGQLVVIGFNPISLWGMCRFFRRKEREKIPWRGHFLSHRRLQDWLALLELTELKSWSDGYGLPVLNNKWRSRSEKLGQLLSRTPACNGAFLMIQARKDVAGMTPITPSWRRQLMTLPIAKPRARGHTRESR